MMIAQVKKEPCLLALLSWQLWLCQIHSCLWKESQYLILCLATGESSKDLKVVFWEQAPDYRSCKTSMELLQELQYFLLPQSVKVTDLCSEYTKGYEDHKGVLLWQCCWFDWTLRLCEAQNCSLCSLALLALSQLPCMLWEVVSSSAEPSCCSTFLNLQMGSVSYTKAATLLLIPCLAGSTCAG